MIDLPRHPKYNLPDRHGSSSNFGRERLVEHARSIRAMERFGLSFASPYLPPLNTPDDKIQRARLFGHANAELGHVDEAQKHLATLETMLSVERTVRYKFADEAEVKARAAKKSEDEIAKLMADALKARSPRIQSLERAIAELKGFQALVAGNRAVAKVEFDKLKDTDEIRRDQLAQVYLRLGDNAEAEKLARQAANDAPDQVYPLATLVAVLSAAGKKPEAASRIRKTSPARRPRRSRSAGVRAAQTDRQGVQTAR